ncbi:MAG TPA: hypothetical protein VHN99_05290, partial [Deinococcales bacterium]|nr:hypothetical protein [Deinococcales bacterium]
MSAFRWEAGQAGSLSLLEGDAGAGAFPGLVDIQVGDAAPVLIPAARVEETAGGALAHGNAAGFEARLVLTAHPHGRLDAWDLTLTLRCLDELAGAVQARLAFQLPASAGEPWFLLPGIVYGENRLPNCTRLYPRFTRGEPGDTLTSDRWAFRADRCATPVVLAAGTERGVALAVDETGELGLQGLGFAHPRGQEPVVWLDFPYREEPVTYTGPGQAEAPDRPGHRWTAGETHRFT